MSTKLITEKLVFDEKASKRLLDAFENSKPLDPNSIVKDNNEISFEELVKLKESKS